MARVHLWVYLQSLVQREEEEQQVEVVLEELHHPVERIKLKHLQNFGRTVQA